MNFFFCGPHKNLLSQLLFSVDIPAALFHFHSPFPPSAVTNSRERQFQKKGPACDLRRL